MDNLREIGNVLRFNLKADKLQNVIIDKKNNYSIADNIFGAMILATAFSSEFDESNNLAKINRMLILSEFVKVNPQFIFKKNLKQGNQFNNEIYEYYNIDSNDTNLVNKYKNLDIELTKLITENRQSDYTDLSEKALEIFKPTNKEDISKYKEIFRFYWYCSKLKDKERAGFDKEHWNINSKRIERISEHTVNTVAFAIGMNSEFNYNIDKDQVINDLVIHEIGESIIGDITPTDGITKEKKKQIEHQAMELVLGNLTKKDEMIKALFEFDDQKTKESVNEHFCDKMQADLKSKLYQDKGQTYPILVQKDKPHFQRKAIKKVVDAGAQTHFQAWYELDKSIYSKTDNKDFEKVLETAKDNDMNKVDMNVVRKQIVLTEEEHETRVQEVGKIAQALMKDDNIEALYLNCYQSEESDKGRIYLTSVLKDGVDYNPYTWEFNDLENESKEKNSDMVIQLGIDYSYQYDEIALNPSQVNREIRLQQSTILFDKKGVVTKKYKEVKNDYNLHPIEVIEYVPPIEKSVVLQLTKN